MKLPYFGPLGVSEKDALDLLLEEDDEAKALFNKLLTKEIDQMILTSIERRWKNWAKSPKKVPNEK